MALICFLKTQISKLVLFKNNNVDSMKKMYTNNDTQEFAHKTCLKHGLWLCYAWVILTPTIVCFFAVSGHRVHVDLPGRLPVRPLTAL